MERMVPAATSFDSPSAISYLKYNKAPKAVWTSSKRKKKLNTYFHKHFLGQTEDGKRVFLRREEFRCFANDVRTFDYLL